MNRKQLILSMLSLVLMSSFTQVNAGEPSRQSFQASGASSGASMVNMSRGSTQLSAGVSSMPLQLSGAVGEFSAAAGDELLNHATDTGQGPLPITDEVITIGPPPNKAIDEE